jgi:hypothetical protein
MEYAMKRCAVPALGLLLVGTLGAAACHRGGPTTAAPTTGAPPAATTSAPRTPAPATGTAGPTSAAPGARWGSTPVTVTHAVPVPPVPLLTGIRSAAHPGYDRVTFDIPGRIPGYDVRYVSTVVGDASGGPVDVPGRRYLQVRFRPAQAHTDAGAATVPRRATFGYPMLRGYVVNGDFEGVLTVTLGLDDVVGFRVGELPGRVYVDIAA